MAGIGHLNIRRNNDQLIEMCRANDVSDWGFAVYAHIDMDLRTIKVFFFKRVEVRLPNIALQVPYIGTVHWSNTFPLKTLAPLRLAA